MQTTDLSYLSNVNGAFIDALYDKYCEDPSLVDSSWQCFFAGFELGFKKAPKNGHRTSSVVAMSEKEVAVMKLINAYRDRGHLLAKISPFKKRDYHKTDLDISYFGLGNSDLDLHFDVGHQIRVGRATLRSIISRLNKTYCSSIGCEYRYIPSSAIRIWLHEEMESIANQPIFSVTQKKQILGKLAEAVEFEKFLHVKYTGQKCFSLGGAEAFIPGLASLFHEGARLGVKEFVFGMPHRGRLNVLVNLFGRSYELMFSEFEGSVLPEHIHGDGDVKYHSGQSGDFITEDGHHVHLSLMANPSHLESVDPIVQGNVRAKGETLYANDFKKIVPVLIHGDAALAGQGVVYEVANLSRLEGYSTGGTIHIVINNRVGFTATYRETRSSLYCTDIAKVTESPVFHVNADDPEAIVHVMRLAIHLRHRFGIDVFIDIICYRRYGHNEGDDPRFTQPSLYEAINEHPTVLDIYVKQLIKENVISDEKAKKIPRDFHELLQKSFTVAKKTKPALQVDFLGRQWEGIRQANANDFQYSIETGSPRRNLDKIAKALVTLPLAFTPYSKMKRLLKRRNEMYFDQEEVDWGMAESLAFGTLLLEQIPVRLSGQDSQRGTFAHRHSVIIDAVNESRYIPLNHIEKDQARFQVYNSHLSEFAVLGFEYGYSLTFPFALVIWEAQFGDFVNGAQIIVDQFVSSSESKWQRMSGLVFFLPHGYEGQGPEHSNARPCRFLNLCAEYNMIVVNPSTPANFFHLLRRQMLQEFRKPLIVLTPKSLLRHPEVKSSITEFEKGSFHELVDDPDVKNIRSICRILLCTGKIYYELLKEKRKRQYSDVAIVRIEQLYPVSREQDAKLIRRYQHVREWIWVQEEPANMGFWESIQHRFTKLSTPLQLISRKESASPATASLKKHLKIQEALVCQAFGNLKNNL